jgi:hypothetical protein
MKTPDAMRLMLADCDNEAVVANFYERRRVPAFDAAFF